MNDSTNTTKTPKIQPQTRLDLSINQNDGTLLTAPLSLIINAATDSLYNDLHAMTNDVLTLAIPTTSTSSSTTTTAAADDIGGNNVLSTNNNNNINSSSTARVSSQRFTTKQETMSNMSFQQRRHILASTLAKHIKSISHISALVASNLFTSGSSSIQTTIHDNTHNDSTDMNKTNNQTSKQQPQINLYTMAQTPPENELSSIAITTSNALNHIRSSWVNADEAQDALYFHHDTLWKVRNHPHDVLGALDVIMKGDWVDLSHDICLKNDGYLDSEEGKWDINETRERLKCAIRRKLVLGEVGMFHQSIMKNKEGVVMKNNPFWWNIVLEQNGTVLRVFHGRPLSLSQPIENNNDEDNNPSRSKPTKVIYPIEARLTILSEQQDKPSPWTLLSMSLHTNVKTGESNHQLELNQEQMYRFHRLCEIAMNQEENRINKKNQEKKVNSDDKNNDNERDQDTKANSQTLAIARPLEKLLDMSHVFSLSWQLEILSSQADELRKGVWASKIGIGGIVVSHVHFFSDDEIYGANNTRVDNTTRPLAVMAIHFWEVDDKNGRPCIGKLADDENDSEGLSSNLSIQKSYLPSSDKNHTKRLTLEITAVPRIGLEVSISGGASVMNKIRSSSIESSNKTHLQRNVKKLLESVQDPFKLSASDALLSAAVICAENRCHATIQALKRLGHNENQNSTSISSNSLQPLPSWMNLSAECGTISVGVSISYHGKEDEKRQPVVLFRLGCDSRTGCFVPIFPESANLLRHLVCNNPNASEIQLLRQAKTISDESSLTSTKRGSVVRSGKELTGRMIRDAFEGLTRSMDILGRRVGVGGNWDDFDDRSSPALREKSIMQSCDDVRSSLMTCSGIAAIYTVGAIAAAVATGVSPKPDM